MTHDSVIQILVHLMLCMCDHVSVSNRTSQVVHLPSHELLHSRYCTITVHLSHRHKPQVLAGNPPLPGWTCGTRSGLTVMHCPRSPPPPPRVEFLAAGLPHPATHVHAIILGHTTIGRQRGFQIAAFEDDRLLCCGRRDPALCRQQICGKCRLRLALRVLCFLPGEAVQSRIA